MHALPSEIVGLNRVPSGREVLAAVGRMGVELR